MRFVKDMSKTKRIFYGMLVGIGYKKNCYKKLFACPYLAAIE